MPPGWWQCAIDVVATPGRRLELFRDEIEDHACCTRRVLAEDNLLEGRSHSVNQLSGLKFGIISKDTITTFSYIFSSFEGHNIYVLWSMWEPIFCWKFDQHVEINSKWDVMPPVRWLQNFFLGTCLFRTVGRVAYHSAVQGWFLLLYST